jgi:hypothetical protein
MSKLFNSSQISNASELLKSEAQAAGQAWNDAWKGYGRSLTSLSALCVTTKLQATQPLSPSKNNQFQLRGLKSKKITSSLKSNTISPGSAQDASIFSKEQGAHLNSAVVSFNNRGQHRFPLSKNLVKSLPNV